MIMPLRTCMVFVSLMCSLIRDDKLVTLLCDNETPTECKQTCGIEKEDGYIQPLLIGKRNWHTFFQEQCMQIKTLPNHFLF